MTDKESSDFVFDVDSVGQDCKDALEGIAPGEFQTGQMLKIAAEVGPDDDELAEQLLKGLAARLRDTDSNRRSKSPLLVQAREAVWFGLYVQYEDVAERDRRWETWLAAYQRITGRSSAA